MGISVLSFVKLVIVCGAEIGGVPYPVEDEQGFAPSSPRRGLPRGNLRGPFLDNDCYDTPVVDRAGYLLQFGGINASVDFLCRREHLAHDPHLAPGAIVEIQPPNGRGIAPESRPHGGKAA